MEDNKNILADEPSVVDEVNSEENYADLENINITDGNYREVFEKYDITDAEASEMLKLMEMYKKNLKVNYYEMLPGEFKNIADGIYNIAKKEGDINTTKNVAAKFLLGQLMSDAELNAAFDEYKDAVSEAVSDMHSEYSKLITQAFDEVFDNIKTIEVNDPEKAEKIKKIKNAFDDAMTFNKQLEFVENTTGNKITKLTKRYEHETSYFNKTVNSTDVKIPKIEGLVDIIYNRLLTLSDTPKYTVDDIKKFIVVICRTTAYKMDVVRNVEDLAYIYRMINTIYLYKFIDGPVNTDDETLLFGNIAKVLDAIINK
jgi:hypothetical protein